MPATLKISMARRGGVQWGGGAWARDAQEAGIYLGGLARRVAANFREAGAKLLPRLLEVRLQLICPEQQEKAKPPRGRKERYPPDTGRATACSIPASFLDSICL
jgi:hypothetical protein